MACIYKYRGVTFQSELELDNFLIDKGDFIDKYGDLVFNATKVQMSTADQLDEIRQKAEQVNGAARIWRAANKTYGEDGEVSIVKPPYIGVNAFLASFKNEQILLEFRDKSYWDLRYANWKEGSYTEQEKETFNVNDGDKLDEADFEKYREKMEFRWKSQAGIGDLVHNVNQLYFSKDENGHYLFEMEEDELIQYINDNLEEKNKKYLTPTAIKESLARVKEIHKELLKLNKKPGDELMFFPEFIISGDATHPDDGTPQKLIGYIDLLVVDAYGNVHILDYKTSTKGYNSFGVAKKLAYTYQLATYQRILEKHGIQIRSGRLWIAPIQINGFRLEGDNYTFDTLSTDVVLDDITNDVTPKKWGNINRFMPPEFHLTVEDDKLKEEVSKIMKKWFPNYSSVREITREDVIKDLKKRNLLKKNDRDEFVFKPFYTKDSPIVSKNEEEFVDKVLEYYKEQLPMRQRTAQNVKGQLKEGIANGVENVDWTRQAQSNGTSVTWFQDNMYKYCNKNWEVVDNDSLEAYGIIMLKNEKTQQVDFIRISTQQLLTNHRNFLDKSDPTKNRLGLVGTYEADVEEQSKSDSLMLEGVNGNIELMEMMAVINQLDGFDSNWAVGNIAVYNPFQATSAQATNEELLYCFNALSNYDAMPLNRFNDGTSNQIRLADRYTLAVNRFRDIMQQAEENEFKDTWVSFKGLQSCQDLLSRQLSEGTKVEDKIDALTQLANSLKANKQTEQKLNRIYKDSKELNSDVNSLYNAILLAITELKGIKLRQQLSDHSKWLQNAMVLRHGLSGTYLDNPGNLDSQTLNLVTRLVTEAYQNTRDEMQRKKAEIRKEVDELKKAKNMSSMALNMGANQVSGLYSNLIEEVELPDGNIDLLFKNINSVSNPAERKFLHFALTKINKNRYPSMSEQELEDKINNYDTEIYRVPLARGQADSEVSSKGLINTFKDRLKYLWNPKKAFQDARDRIEGVVNASESIEDQRKRQATEGIFRMTNLFDEGEESVKNRLEAIKRKGIHTFERNLELLLLKHDFAYIQQSNMDKVFPIIKAATIHLAQQGSNQNTTFERDMDYMQDYIKNKILNESIINPDFKSAVQIANGVKRAASILTLAFSPVQALYQPLQGLWQDISLMIRKPDGKNSFTFKHFRNAFKIVSRDFVNYTDKPTLCSLLNELYAINDMDMNVYAERISKARKGIWNFENLMMKFASRPDYYNRMSIFLSQMQGDGCLEAHEVKDGKLVYDWTKDKRFSKFAANPTLNTTDAEYNKQKQLYYAIAKQFETEGATVEVDGKVVPFKLNMAEPMPLPRAYTNRQAEGMKSLADDIYGYYSHEKKSLIMATGLGSLWLQFKTYWSGKKNQYLQSGGVRMRGDWVQKTQTIKDENGNKIEEKPLYYQVDKTGAIQYDKPLTTEPTVAPVMQWKGQWQEGILVTLGDIAYQTLQNPRDFIRHFKDKWNHEDPNLRNCYRSNMKQITYDMLMFLVLGSILGALLGDWLKELKDENEDNTDFMTGVKLAGVNVLAASVKNSFLDLNFVESIGSPIGSWTPFAFEWTSRQWSNISKVASGDEDLWDGVLKIASGSKQIKPMFDALKPEMFRTKREGGTWESATVKRNREKREGQ